MEWLKSHWMQIAVVVAFVLPSLITGLSRYPKAAGVVHWLRVALDLLSVVTHADSPGSLKVPVLQRSKSPAGDPPPPVGVGTPLCLLMVLALTACTPRQTIAWQQLGGDSLGCLSPGLSGALSGAVDGAIKEIGGQGADWGAYGRGLVTSYGSAAALCIVQQAIARLGPVLFGAVPDKDPRLGLRWLDANRAEWLR